MTDSGEIVAALKKINQRLDGIESGLKRSQKATKRKSKDHDAEALVKFVDRKLKTVSDDIQEALYLNTLGFHLLAPWVCLAILMAAQLVKGASPTDWAKIILHTLLPVSGLVPMSDPKQDVLPAQNGDEVIDTSTVQQGQKIGSYAVTSGYGPRSSPGGIGSTFHEGADVAVPIGTAVKMPMTGIVECHDQSEGNAAGTYAIIKPDGQLYSFMAGHLSQCSSGKFQAGQAIALSGSTGHSTGPHLHWGQKVGGKYIPPQRGYLELAVLGTTERSSSNTNPVIKAIATQESGGDYSQVNSDSGALGKYQIMPANIPSWSQECLGQSISAQQFLGSASQQEKIATCKLTHEFERSRQSGESSFEACRSTASFWYSGSAGNKNSSAPQGKYPSIQDYTIQVCSKVGKYPESASATIAQSQTTFAIYAGLSFGSAVSLGNGCLLTNRHVITGSATANVRLADGAIIKARVIKQSSHPDLAILKIDRLLPAVRLASAVHSGQAVVAIGNPLNRGITKTRGTVNAVGAWVNHSAKLAVGNSGGALLNDRGELVGINTRCMVGKDGACTGEEEAIPINQIKEFIN